MHLSIVFLPFGFSVPRARRASEYVQIHCVYMTPHYWFGGIRKMGVKWISQLDIPQKSRAPWIKAIVYDHTFLTHKKKTLPLHQQPQNKPIIVWLYPTVYCKKNYWTELQLSKSDLEIVWVFFFLFVQVHSFVITLTNPFSSVQFTPVYSSSIQWSVYSTDVLRLCEYGCMNWPSLRGKPQVLHCLKVMSLICLFE